MGYPRIPMSDALELVVTTGEVNSVVSKYGNMRHPYFILSPVPRGGFSGAPVIHEGNLLLGVYTESLNEGGKHLENGFAAALTIEPLLVLLDDHKILIKDNENICYDLG